MEEETGRRILAYILASIFGLSEFFIGNYIIRQIIKGLTSFLSIPDIFLLIFAICGFVILFLLAAGFFLVAVYGDDVDQIMENYLDDK